MTANAVQTQKAARGTKRECQACAARFYDLGREQIVCPSCGAAYTPAALPTIDSSRRAAPAGKTGWRQSVKRPVPAPRVMDAEEIAPVEVADAEDLDAASEEVARPSPEDDAVLEPDADDPDFSGLVEVDVESPKET